MFQLSWLGLYGHPTPKASWLLGTPSWPYKGFQSLHLLILLGAHVQVTTFHINGSKFWILIIRSWIASLNDYLPKSKRDELKRQCELNGFQMVRQYQDSRGTNRVYWAYLIQQYAQAMS
jgi:hypothetical protein